VVSRPTMWYAGFDSRSYRRNGPSAPKRGTVILLLTSLLLSSWPGWGLQDSVVLSAAAFSATNDSFVYLRPILTIAGLSLGAVALVAGQAICRSRHNLSIAREARELGLAFSADGKPFEGSDVHGLPFLEGDPCVEAANVVEVTIDGRQALVLDLASVETCEAETPHQRFTTVAAFRCPRKDMLEFEIGKKSPLAKIGDALWQKPELLEDREFAKEFFVHCREPKKVHDWLTPEKLAKLRPAVTPFHVSANAEWVLIFRPGAQISAAQFPAFLRESSKIASALLQ